MIKFACPTCGNGLSAPDHKGGSLTSCPACAQMVQVPALPDSSGGDSARPKREGTRAFWALVRFFLWGICFAAVVLSVTTYFLEADKKKDLTEKGLFTLQALVWVLGSYYIARTFEDSSKSLEELVARLRRKR